MSAFKCAADGLLLAEDVQVLFHALATSVVKTMDGRIDVLLLETKSGRVAVRGRCFVDCSGDGDIAQWAGVAAEKGDEQGRILTRRLCSGSAISMPTERASLANNPGADERG